jgi:hypothetical protein
MLAPYLYVKKHAWVLHDGCRSGQPCCPFVCDSCATAARADMTANRAQ